MDFHKKTRKGFFGVWSVPFIFIVTVIIAVTLLHMIPHILEWLGFEKRPIFVMEKQPAKTERFTYEKKKHTDYLAPTLVLKIKSMCTCGFDFEPWKDNKTHLISHGMCVHCYVKTMQEIGIQPKTYLVVSGIKRMINAERWWSV